MKQSLFRKNSLDGISTPDQLNDYIKVSNPRVWMVLAALFILLASVIIWGFAGSLPTTVRCDGVVLNGSAVCYVSLEDAEPLRAGQQVTAVNDSFECSGQISQISAVPLSAAEIDTELHSDYLFQKLISADYAVKVSLALDTCVPADGTLLEVRIVTDALRPIDFFIN